MDISTGEGVSVYAEAKGEYTKQLCQYMVPALQQYFLDLLEEAKLKEPEPRKLLLTFQTLLEAVADWNMDKVQRETSSLADSTHCDYLEELITAVFIAHTKVLSAIRLTTKQKKLQITIPKLDHFLHRTLTECARLLWSNTYLFSTSAAAIERQKNLRQIESLLTDGVLQSIRSMLPVKNILREYLKEDSSDDEAAEAVAAVAASAPAAAAEATEAEDSKEAAEAATSEAVAAAAAAPATPPPSPEAATAGEAAATTGPIFTGMETEFQSAEGDLPDLESEDGEDGEDREDEEDADDEEGNDIPEFQEENLDIQILDEPPVALDNFEDLDAPAAAAPPSKAEEEETLGMEDFEVLE
jgi:hypothetical protein